MTGNTPHEQAALENAVSAMKDFDAQVTAAADADDTAVAASVTIVAAPEQPAVPAPPAESDWWTELGLDIPEDRAGFAAALPAPVATEQQPAASAHDAFAAQLALDKRLDADAAKATDEKSLTALTQAALTAPYAAKTTLGPVKPGSYNTSGYAPSGSGKMYYTTPHTNPAPLLRQTVKPQQLAALAAALPVAALAVKPSVATPAASPAVSGIAPAATPRAASLDNYAALQRLEKLLGISAIEPRSLLTGITLVTAHRDRYTLPQGVDSDIFKTTSNTAVVARGLCEFQDETPVSAADALEGAIIALNDKASYPNGVELRGSTRDRYMLQQAACRVGLRVANPVEDTALTVQEREDIESDFIMHLVNSGATATQNLDDKVSASADPAANTTPLAQADVDRVNDIVTGKSAPVAAPQQPKRMPSPALA